MHQVRLLAVALLALALGASGPGVAQSIDDNNPDSRALAVELAAKANNRQSAQTVMSALAKESDGPAGFKMAEHVALLTSAEALEVVERNVLGFSRPENLFGAYWTFVGLIRQNTERSLAIVDKAVNESKEGDIYLRSAAIEALAYSRRTDRVELLIAQLKTIDAKRMEGEHLILTMTCIVAAPRIADKELPEKRNEVVLALADILENAKDDRVQWFTCQALSQITGEDTFIDPEFWRWWVRVGGVEVKRQKDGHTVANRDVPRFFKAAAVGKRVVFAIDISGSMQHPVELPPEMRKPPETPEPERKRPVTGRGKSGEPEPEPTPPPPPDYSKVKSKLDLAKVELIHTLTHLPEDYWFNIVLYHTPHAMLDQGKSEFVQATEANKRHFINKVEKLHWAQLTNIHGALVRSYCVNGRKSIDPMRIGRRENDPSWDPECMRSGATTIFFLTDGSPTISDDSTDIRTVGTPNGPRRGNGRMVQPRNIVEDVRRLNTFRKVVINTVGIGPHNQGLMQALARETGGEYIDRSGFSRRGD